jgi:hypothetical protein
MQLTLLLKPECRECALRERCNNSCGCLNWQTTGSVNAISPTVCRHGQMLMPIADHIGRELHRRRESHFLHKHYNAAYPALSMIEDASLPRESHNLPERTRASNDTLNCQPQIP